MKIIGVQSLVVPDVKVIRYARFQDARGYFTETHRRSDVFADANTAFLRETEFVQCNESVSKPGVVRGLHFQWNPFMGKLVRTLYGWMVDLALDIRPDSPTFGKIAAYDMPARRDEGWGEWIWVPPGFAHGNFFLEESAIEYFCTGEHSPGCEAGLSPLAADIDWSLCAPALKQLFDQTLARPAVLTDKDRNGLSVRAWKKDPRSALFTGLAAQGGVL